MMFFFTFSVGIFAEYKLNQRGVTQCRDREYATKAYAQAYKLSFDKEKSKEALAYEQVASHIFNGNNGWKIDKKAF